MRPIRSLFLALVPSLVACSSTVMAPADGSADGALDALSDAGMADAPDTFLAPFDASADAEDAAADAAVDAPPPLGAPYPVVLAHGFFGFEDFAGIDFIQYFFGVVEDLDERGESLVFTPTVDPFNSSTVRGERLIDRIEAILAETGHAKVNIIGHSQGGIDARYAASVRPDLVESVTTISSPHRGTPLLDFVLRALEDSSLARFIDDLVRLIGAPLYDEVGEETSLFDAFRQLSESGSTTFNEMHPDVAGIDYYSVAGRSGNTFARRDCRPDGIAPDFISRWNSTIDPVDPLFALSEALYDGTIFEPTPNDGLVTIQSARWGTFLGCVPADHMDEVGQLLGDEPGLLNRWDHRDFFFDLISWLRDQGH